MFKGAKIKNSLFIDARLWIVFSLIQSKIWSHKFLKSSVLNIISMITYSDV